MKLLTRLSVGLFGLMAATAAFAQEAPSSQNIFANMESVFATFLVAPLAKLLFFNVAFFTETVEIPFIVLWLMIGAVFLTVRMSFISLRGFKHAIRITRGDFDDKHDPGEITHFQALSSALSATIGLGNISGVAVAWPWWPRRCFLDGDCWILGHVFQIRGMHISHDVS